MTCRRLLDSPFFGDRANGWLSLSGGRIGGVPRSEGAGVPSFPGGPQMGFSPEELARLRASLANRQTPTCRLSSPPASTRSRNCPPSRWGGALRVGSRVRQPDVVDSEPGQVWDMIREGHSTPQWGLLPRPGTAQIYVYPDARGGRLIVDVIRLDKGHTEGLEPHITEHLVAMMVAAPGGKLQAAANTTANPAFGA